MRATAAPSLHVCVQLPLPLRDAHAECARVAVRAHARRRPASACSSRGHGAASQRGGGAA
eukprot:804325-Pleurochrysis_carterae.AAC.1